MAATSPPDPARTAGSASGSDPASHGRTRPPIRVLAVDDDQVMRALSVELVGSDPDLCVVAQADTVLAALECFREVPLDVVVLDHGLPGGTVEDVLAAVRSRQPSAAAVLLTGRQDAAARGVKLGFNGSVRKADAGAMLVAEVRRVAGVGPR